jgi:hypothetical protein
MTQLYHYHSMHNMDEELTVTKFKTDCTFT